MSVPLPWSRRFGGDRASALGGTRIPNVLIRGRCRRRVGSLPITAGYLLGAQWERVLVVTEPFQTLVVALMGVALVALIIRKVVTTRRTRVIEVVSDTR